jgi:hypothetical protein
MEMRRNYIVTALLGVVLATGPISILALGGPVVTTPQLAGPVHSPTGGAEEGSAAMADRGPTAGAEEGSAAMETAAAGPTAGAEEGSAALG